MHLIGFIIRIYNTMHGPLNVKHVAVLIFRKTSLCSMVNCLFLSL